jgi:hypothetical protein
MRHQTERDFVHRTTRGWGIPPYKPTQTCRRKRQGNYVNPLLRSSVCRVDICVTQANRLSFSGIDDASEGGNTQYEEAQWKERGLHVVGLGCVVIRAKAKRVKSVLFIGRGCSFITTGLLAAQKLCGKSRYKIPLTLNRIRPRYRGSCHPTSPKSLEESCLFLTVSGMAGRPQRAAECKGDDAERLPAGWLLSNRARS